MSDDTPLRVGDPIYGFCGGKFGRDHFHDCRVEAIGADWVVVRPVDSLHDGLGFYEGKPEDLCQYRVKPKDDG